MLWVVRGNIEAACKGIVSDGSKYEKEKSCNFGC